MTTNVSLFLEAATFTTESQFIKLLLQKGTMAQHSPLI